MTFSRLMLTAAALLWIGSFAVAQDSAAPQVATPPAAQACQAAATCQAAPACQAAQACPAAAQPNAGANVACGKCFVDANNDGVCDLRQGGAPARAPKAGARRGPRFVDKNNDGVCDQRQALRPPAARMNGSVCPQCGYCPRCGCAMGPAQGQPLRGGAMRGFARGQGPTWGPPMAMRRGPGFGRGQTAILTATESSSASNRSASSSARFALVMREKISSQTKATMTITTLANMGDPPFRPRQPPPRTSARKDGPSNADRILWDDHLA